MRKSVKLFVVWCGILCCALCTLFATGWRNAPARAVTAEEEQKTYCTATPEDDFAEDSVLVVLDRQTGGVNKVHSEDYFGTFEKEAIYDLTYAADPTVYDAETFHQILQIELAEPGKENVLDAVHELERIDGILSAEPDYISQAESLPENATGNRYDDMWDCTARTGSARRKRGRSRRETQACAWA